MVNLKSKLKQAQKQRGALLVMNLVISAGVGGGLRRDPDRAEKSAGAGVSGQIQAEDQTQDLNFSAKLLPPSLT